MEHGTLMTRLWFLILLGSSLSHASEVTYRIIDHMKGGCYDVGSGRTAMTTQLDRTTWCNKISGVTTLITRSVSSCSVGVDLPGVSSIRIVVDSFICTDYPTCKSCQTTKDSTATYTSPDFVSSTLGQCFSVMDGQTGQKAVEKIRKYGNKTGWVNPCPTFNAAGSGVGQGWFQPVVSSVFSATLLFLLW
mmetsp:Transcript_15415/g.30312  ORF Transcript_15415/g.30312 Transcript_15415/m.30312 type:complete len:190 (-) Transcript_15415:145-714(-)|eukprot:CAMPEP_0175152002 /NCGR_PEP_ID=MMETSP0087-20121206/18851_1 /TAXON_ID=136419 /ORGANISM="Unknown Unknown, Strain D1" /LENGTH=189 /DNA_ID=CAMNT_0016438345 /DNA_START=33 /DNA_END=599 /DNA_ORIENTATION=+